MPNTPCGGVATLGGALRQASSTSMSGALAPIDNLLPARSPLSKPPRPLSAPGGGSEPATPAQPRARPAEEDRENGEEPSALDDVEDPLAESLCAARLALRDPGAAAGSASGGAPLGREQQHARLLAAAEAFAGGAQGQALYVSGLPGTGKSHTVRRALRALDYAGDVTTLWINCMAVGGATEVYARIAAALAAAGGGGGGASVGAKRSRARGGGGGFAPAETGAAAGPSSISYEKLLAALAEPPAPSGGGKRRRSAAGGGSRGGGGGATAGHAVAVVLDEVDALVSKGNQGMYELFMLPHHPGVRALVVGIANSIDLTERALPALKLRGCTPALVAFPAYTTAQVARILRSCLDDLPDRLIDPTAVELCARQVASTTGDLRLAVKACRAALDALAASRLRALAAAAAVTAAGGDAPKPPQACVGARDMMQALGRLAGVRSSQHGAATVATIRGLPNQQQLLLYALSVLCPPPEDDAGEGAGPAPSARAAAGIGYSTPPTAGRTKSVASMWAEATPGGGAGGGPRAVHVRTPSSAAAGVIAGRRLFGAGGRSGKGGGSFGGGAGGGSGRGAGGAGAGYVLAAAFEDAFLQYCKVCRLVGMASATRLELRHMADLLAQMALVDVIVHDASGAGGGGAGGGQRTPGGLAPTPSRGRKGPRGFGGGGGSAAASPAAGAGAGGGGGGAKLALRAGHEDVHRALAANPALRCLVDA